MSEDRTMETIKLARDLKKAAVTMSETEARFLVDSYYQMQDNRIRAAGQARSMEHEPHALLSWLEKNNQALETQVKNALGEYAKSKPAGQWALGICGVGPVITAGLLAHIDITKAPTVGHIWSYAGLNPEQKWNKGEKRPWNASLKTLCWKIGECFVKVSTNAKDYYGHFYLERKAMEKQKNENGEFKEQAAEILERTPNHAQKAIYSKGMLSDGHIHSRAKRYAVKLFLSHFHHVMCVSHYNQEPPLPFPIAHQGHAHNIKPPAAAA